MNTAQTRAAITKITGDKVSTYTRLDSPETYDCQANSGEHVEYWYGWAESKSTATLNVMSKLLYQLQGLL